jgi:hypothetical protein
LRAHDRSVAGTICRNIRPAPDFRPTRFAAGTFAICCSRYRVRVSGLNVQSTPRNL